MRIAVSEQSDSRSPVRPQLHRGTSPSMPGIAACGMSTWPSSPPKPWRPVTTRPPVTTPPPSPVPTMADTLVASFSEPKIETWPHSAAALPSLR